MEEDYNTSEDKKQFLVDNGFTGMKDYDFEGTSGPDGYGHQTGRSRMLDFEGKNCYIGGWSSD